MISKLLVVCIGNICRSPMAEAMFKVSLPECTVTSAGLGALVGKPADPHAVSVMKSRGMDITNHRAKQFESWMINAAEVILVMDAEQKRHIETRHPISRGKVFRLGESGKFDIADPYRQSLGEFERSAGLIAQGVEAWSAKIRAIAQNS